MTTPVTAEATPRDLVNEDFRAAAVFFEYGIEFCCGGGRPLSEACSERGVDAGAVVRDVTAACTRDARADDADTWSVDRLTRHIVGTHHDYVRHAAPAIVAHARKLASAHGASRAELVEVADLFETVAEELLSHQKKEEQVLFPAIEALATGRADVPFATLAAPIRRMEADHDEAIETMRQIRLLTGDYLLPAHACTTYRVCFRELEAFEKDLTQHIDLENRVLFPKALALAPAAAG